MALNTITQVKLLNGKVVDLVDWSDQPLFSSVDLQTGFTTQEISLFQYVVGDAVPGFSPNVVTTRTASDNDTNIATPGAMASTEEMLVYALKPECYFYLTDAQAPTGTVDFNTRTYLPDAGPGNNGFPIPTAEGLAVFAQQLILQLEISQKVFAQASVAYFNTGYGVFSANGGSNSAAGGFGNSYGNAGLPSQEAVRSFVIPHHIGGQEKYRVMLINPSDINDGAVSFGIVNSGESSIVLNELVVATFRILMDGLYKRPVA